MYYSSVNLKDVFKWYVVRILQRPPFVPSYHSFLALPRQTQVGHSLGMLCMSVPSVFILVLDNGVISRFSLFRNNVAKNILIPWLQVSLG